MLIRKCLRRRRHPHCQCSLQETPADVLAPYQPKSTTERPAPYTLAEFAHLVASNQRPLRFVAIRSTISSVGTPEVVYMDIQ